MNGSLNEYQSNLVTCYVCGESFFCPCFLEQDIEPKERTCALSEGPPNSQLWHIGNRLELIHICSERCVSLMRYEMITSSKNSQTDMEVD